MYLSVIPCSCGGSEDVVQCNFSCQGLFLYDCQFFKKTGNCGPIYGVLSFGSALFHFNDNVMMWPQKEFVVFILEGK